jgi:hypothetical protein
LVNRSITTCAILLSLAGAITAQTTDDSDRVRLRSPQSRTIGVGETVEIRLSAPREEGEELALVLPPLPEGIALDSQPVFVRRGATQLQARIRIRGVAPGRYVLRGVGVRVDDRSETATIEPVLVSVADPDGATPFRVRWRVLADGAYVGRSIPVVLEMVLLDQFTYPNDIRIRAPEQGLFEEVAGLGSVTSETIGDVDLYEVPVAGFLFTPGVVGSTLIPSAEVSALGFTVQSEPRAVVTRDLPASVSPTGAVGVFSVSIEAPSEILEPDATGELVISIEGRGNLPVLDFPGVEFRGLTVLDDSERSVIDVDTAELLGYAGSRVRTYRFQTDGSSDISTITIDSFSALDPRTGRVSTTAGRTIRLETPRADSDDVVAAQPPAYQLIEIDELGRLKWYPLTRFPWAFWVFLVPPALLAIALVIRAARSDTSATIVTLVALSLPVFLAFSIRPALSVERLTRAAELAAIDRPGTAGVLYDFELRDNPDNAALHYNRGVLALRAGDAARSVYHMRRAVRIVPESTLFRSGLDDVYAYFQRPVEFPIPQYPRLFVWYLGLLVLWSAFCLVFFLRGGTRRSIILLTVAFLHIPAIAGSVWAFRIGSTPDATVMQEAIVRRIPDTDASPWVRLQPSTVVMVELGYEEFYLIRTGAGVTGWIPVATVEFSDKERLDNE